MVKAPAGMIKICDNLLKAEKQNLVVITKGLLPLFIDSIMLLGHENLSMNNMRRGEIKKSLQKGLQFLCEEGYPPTTLFLGDELLKKVWEVMASPKLTLHPLP